MHRRETTDADLSSSASRMYSTETMPTQPGTEHGIPPSARRCLRHRCQLGFEHSARGSPPATERGRCQRPGPVPPVGRGAGLEGTDHVPRRRSLHEGRADETFAARERADDRAVAIEALRSTSSSACRSLLVFRFDPDTPRASSTPCDHRLMELRSAAKSARAVGPLKHERPRRCRHIRAASTGWTRRQTGAAMVAATAQPASPGDQATMLPISIPEPLATVVVQTGRLETWVRRSAPVTAVAPLPASTDGDHRDRRLPDETARLWLEWSRTSRSEERVIAT